MHTPEMETNFRVLKNYLSEARNGLVVFRSNLSDAMECREAIINAEQGRMSANKLRDKLELFDEDIAKLAQHADL